MVSTTIQSVNKLYSTQIRFLKGYISLNVCVVHHYQFEQQATGDDTNMKQESLTPPPGCLDVEPYIKQECHNDIGPGMKNDSPTLPTPSPESLETRPGSAAGRSTQQRPAPPLVRSGLNAPQALDKANILVTYGPAFKRLLLFDYDGTLTDIVPNPRDALLGEPVFDELKILASHPKNMVWIISGRDRYFLEKEPGRVAELGLVAEHGAFMRYPRSTEWLDIRGEIDMSWQHRVETVMRKYKANHPGSVIETKTASVVWHYRNAHLTSEAPAEELMVDLGRILGPEDPVEVKRGKCIVEVRLSFINKGQIAQRLAQEYEPKFVLCVGDDVTDEGNIAPVTAVLRHSLSKADMFVSLLHHSDLPSGTVFTVVVGSTGPDTYACWYIDEPVDLIGNIIMLIECDRTGNTTGGMMPGGISRGSRPHAVPRSHLIRAKR